MKSIIFTLLLSLLTHLSASATPEERKSFKEGCENGSPRACYNLAMMYEYGDGVAVDDALALKYYLQICKSNHYTSCVKAANLYENSLTIEQNIDEANKLYTKACGGDNAKGCHNVALTYAKSDNPVMKKYALIFYDKACRTGYAPSCIYLGRKYRDSKSLTHDYEKAKEVFDIACELNDRLGCKELRILEELEKSGYAD